MQTTFNVNMTPAEFIQRISSALNDAGIDEGWSVDEIIFSSHNGKESMTLLCTSDELNIVVNILYDEGRIS